jgi:two-component system nitrate/nitrite response regulator NarL
MASSAGAAPLRPAAPRVVIADDDACFAAACARRCRTPASWSSPRPTTAATRSTSRSTSTPTLVLMDVVMVGLDGISATRAIADRAPEVQVVLLTSSHDAELGMIGLRAGADGHLVKGLDLDDLVSAVRTAAAGDPCSRRPSRGGSSSACARCPTAAWACAPCAAR